MFKKLRLELSLIPRSFKIVRAQSSNYFEKKFEVKKLGARIFLIKNFKQRLTYPNINNKMF